MLTLGQCGDAHLVALCPAYLTSYPSDLKAPARDASRQLGLVGAGGGGVRFRHGTVLQAPSHNESAHRSPNNGGVL